MKNKINILCVDDEINILDGLRLQLRKDFNVLTANSGAEGLATLKKDRDIAVIISDMRMPEMNGAEFLKAAKIIAPDATRLLLTGQSELYATVAAINEGQIFRFLTKPCPKESLLKAAHDAYEQYTLVTGRKVLLEKTLNGSIRLLSKVLSISRPLAFGNSDAVRRLAISMGKALKMKQAWQIEIAATFYFLGHISFNDELEQKLYDGGVLSDDEKEIVAHAPSISQDLIHDIPHLEHVSKIISQINTNPDNQLPETSLLRLCITYVNKINSGMKPENALAYLRSEFDTTYIEALSEVLENDRKLLTRIEVNLKQLKVGMITADKITDKNGTVLVASGFEVSTALLGRLNAIGAKKLNEPIYVYVTSTEESQP